MPFGLALNEGGKFAGKIIRREPQIEIAGNVFSAQRAECKLFAKMMGHHLRLVTLQRMAAALDVRGPERAHDEQTLGVDALAEMTQQVDARRIGPVNIFKKYYQRIIRCQGSESITHFAQHSFLGGTDCLALQTLQRSG